MRNFRVFLSSPGDVAHERHAAHEILRNMPEEPAWVGRIAIQVVRWDNPNSPTPMYANFTPQDAVNLHLPKPSECDLVVLLLWSRFGTPLLRPVRPDGTRYQSGTEWEYEDARDANVRILVFRRVDDPQVSLRDGDFAERRRQLGLVDAFFDRLTGAESGPAGGFIRYTEREFEIKFRRIVESAFRQILDAEASGSSEKSSSEMIKRLTMQLEEKERQNASLRQLVLKETRTEAAVRLPGGGDAKGESPSNQPPIQVSITQFDNSQAGDLERPSDVVAVARVMPLKLVAPLEEGNGPEKIPVTWGVSAVGADTSPFSGEGIVVAILDTGIDHTHSAFAGVELIERDFTGEGNGDVHGHGTHFAGTVFGSDVEGVRIGIARGVRRVLIGKIVGTEGSSSDILVNAIQWAITEGADLIAMSVAFDTLALERQLLISGMSADLARAHTLEGYRANELLFEKLISLLRASSSFGKPTQLIAAAGNDGQKEFRAPVGMPAGLEGILSVASLVNQPTGLTIAPFSNVGAVVSAPGVRIVSARVGGGLTTLSGTSASTAHAVGVAALWGQKIARSGAALDQVVPRLLAAATKTLLREGSSPLDVGAGLVRAPQN